MKNKIKVAFQGEKGAYSHLACLEVFPNADAIACSTFEETFQLAKDNSEYKIVIPIENSLAGRVADIHYLIPKYRLQIHAEHFQKVTHNLLGIKGSKIKDIKTVRSHSQAIGQCNKMIFENKLKPIISADTAGSAKFISEKKIEDCLFASGEIDNENIKQKTNAKLKTRKSGSAALDMAYVASGRYDGYFQKNLNLWDIAAGIIIVKEAGGQVNDLNLKQNNNIKLY